MENSDRYRRCGGIGGLGWRRSGLGAVALGIGLAAAAPALAAGLGWEQLSAAQQAVLAAQKPGWDSLPPERQQRLARGAERWSAMSPAERQQARERLRRWREVGPPQRDRLRANAAPAWMRRWIASGHVSAMTRSSARRCWMSRRSCGSRGQGRRWRTTRDRLAAQPSPLPHPRGGLSRCKDHDHDDRHPSAHFPQRS